MLCIDFDPSGNLSDYMGHEPDELPTINELLEAGSKGTPIDAAQAVRKNAEGIDYIPADDSLNTAEIYLVVSMCRELALRRVLEDPVFQQYEYILVDCYPGLGILLTNALAASDSILIPVMTQKWGLSSIDRLLVRYEEVRRFANPSLQIEGVLLTMVNNTNMSHAVEDAARERFTDCVYKTCINDYVEAANSAYAQKSLLEMRGSRLGEAYREVAKELLVHHAG